MDNSYFEKCRTGDYQRENFDNFLSKVKFSYNVPSIHIAGTNGKGSVATYIANMYRACGYKVGLFTSPFFDEPNEMISINGKNISDEDFLAVINKYKKEIAKCDLSAFEIQAFVAFNYFQDNKCDIAFIECGMGGLIDATNVFTPILSVITSVSLEHTDYLGYSISEIAAQKAGIIKEEVPVLVGDLPEEAITVVIKKAKECKSKIYYLGHYVNKSFSKEGFRFDYGELKDLHIQSLADYSVGDACIALEAIYSLKDSFPYSEDKIKQGLFEAFIPGRLEVMREHPCVIIDGGHNPAAISALCERSLFNVTQGRPIHVVFACFRDKNLGNMLNSLGAITEDLTITTFDHPRARTEDEYFLFLGDYTFENDAKGLIERKISEFPDDVILVTGSLAFASLVRRWFKNGQLK